MIVEPIQCLFRNNFDDDSLTFPSVARVLILNQALLPCAIRITRMRYNTSKTCMSITLVKVGPV